MLTNADKDKVKDFIDKGQKLAAVKYLRDRHGLTLQAASGWVDYLNGNTLTPPTVKTEQNNPATPLTSVAKERVKSMVRKGQTLDAIKYLRDEFQLSLVQAKQLTDLAAEETGTYTTAPFRFNSSFLVFYIFAFVGTIFLLVSTYLWWRDYQITHDSITVTGRVIDLQYGSADHNSGAIPVISYTWKGKRTTVYGSTSSNPPAVEIGEPVEIIINRTDPGKVVINLLSERYFLIIIFGIMGFIFGAIGYIGSFYRGVKK
jgi:ribosomal protein L7/L12